jgi:ketosteroid isomerase-like protein
MRAQDSIFRMYAAFNRRDVDGTLAFMSEDVSWPKASEGGRVVGKQAIRQYWARQWREFDPLVTVQEIDEREDGAVAVRVHQLVKDRAGNVLSDTVLRHVYSFADDSIIRMDIEDEGSSEEASQAFSLKPGITAAEN